MADAKSPQVVVHEDKPTLDDASKKNAGRSAPKWEADARERLTNRD